MLIFIFQLWHDFVGMTKYPGTLDTFSVDWKKWQVKISGALKIDDDIQEDNLTGILHKAFPLLEIVVMIVAISGTCYAFW